MQAPAAAPLLRQPAVKLRPFFWNKLAWRPDVIWSRVPQGALTEDQLRALEALFPQAAASPQGKAMVRGVPASFACTCTCHCHLGAHGSQGPLRC